MARRFRHDAQWASYRSQPLFLAGDREKLARVAPHVQAALLPGVGHDFFVVRAEEVNRRVITFLTA